MDETVNHEDELSICNYLAEVLHDPTTYIDDSVFPSQLDGALEIYEL